MKIKHLRFRTFALSMGIAMFLLATAFVFRTIQSNDSKKNVAYYQAENDYLTSLRANPATGTVTPSDFAKARNEVAKFLAKNSRKNGGLTWETAGPDNLAGRIRSLIKDEETGYWYAGAVNGGIWRVMEGEQVWTSLPGEAGEINVSCLYKAPNGTMYAGTGESYYSEDFNLLPGFKGRGIFKSSDGETFSVIENTVPAAGTTVNNDWFYVNKITSSGNNLYAGTNTGLFYSDMNGTTWALAKTVDGVELSGECTEAVTGTNAVAVFVNGLAYISQSGNPTEFKCISNGTMLPDENIGRIAFAFAPTNTDYLYAVTIYKDDIAGTQSFNEQGTLENIYLAVKGSTGWSDWTVIGPGGSSHMFYLFEANGLYSLALLVDPNNENIVYVGGTDMWKGTEVGSEFYQWTQQTTSEDMSSSAYVPQNHFAYLMTASHTFAIACENGVYTYDPSSIKARSFNTNLTTSQFYTVSANYKNDIFGGSQGNGTVGIYRKGSVFGKSGINLHITIGNTVGISFVSNNIGGYVHNSMIYPIGTILSIDGNDDLKNSDLNAFADFAGVQSLTIYRFDDQVPQNMSWWYHTDGKTVIKAMEDSANYITPSILWEDFDYDFSVDSVAFIAGENLAAGTEIVAASKNAGYPIPYVLEKPLSEGDTIMIQDKIASRFFVGVNGTIFMTKEASNFNVDIANASPWFAISSNLYGGIEGSPQCMGLSKDANYLYVGTTDGKLYRVANIAYAHDATTANIYTGNLFGSSALNPYCVISTDLIASFEGRIITSVSVNQTDPEMVIVTLGNYGCEDYLYISNNALDEFPNFAEVETFANTPLFTSIFVEGNDNSNNMVMVGCDFGVYSTNDITASSVTWETEMAGMGELPVFMLKQQNVQTINDNPVYYGDTFAYITNYHGIYAATYGGGLFECLDYVKAGTSPSGISNNSSLDKSVSIFPNPVRDNATITVDLNTTSDAVLYIYNMSGKLQKVVSKRAQSEKAVFEINTSSLTTGSYIARIVTGNGQHSAKFIVVK